MVITNFCNGKLGNYVGISGLACWLHCSEQVGQLVTNFSNCLLKLGSHTDCCALTQHLVIHWCLQYSFKHTTSSPHFPQSKGISSRCYWRILRKKIPQVQCHYVQFKRVYNCWCWQEFLYRTLSYRPETWSQSGQIFSACMERLLLIRL